MGHWGLGIKQNDVFADVYLLFQVYYNENYSIEKITDLLEKECFNDDDEYADFWISVAYCQWMAKSLDETVKKKILDIYHNNTGLMLYQDDIKDFEKKKNIIHKFIEKIIIPREKPLKRKKTKPYPAPFQVGDCISFKIDDYYGACYILTKREISFYDLNKEGSHSIAILDYLDKEKITLNKALDTKILYTTHRDFNMGYNVNSFGAKQIQKDIKNIEVVGNIKINQECIDFVNTTHNGKTFNYDHWKDVRDVIKNENKHKKISEQQGKDIYLKEIISSVEYWKYMLKDRYIRLNKTLGIFDLTI